MTNHDDTDRMLDNVTHAMRTIVDRAALTIAELDGLAESFGEIDVAIGRVVEVLGRVDGRVARLENTEQGR